MIAVFLGPPGSGKGTQAARLAERYGVVHFDMGRSLREESATGSGVGKTIKTYTDRGELVPLPIIKMIILKALKGAFEKNIILDGFPRSKEQAQLLDAVLSEYGANLDFALYFQIDERVLVNRIVNRRQCPVCKRVYNLSSAPPIQETVCDIDGAELEKRPDDNEKVIMNRFRVYQRETQPILELYRASGKLKEVDAATEIEVLEGEVAALLKLK